MTKVLGHRYAGVDVSGQDADVLGDAHCLPFRTASFDHVITNAVLAHVTNPFLATREVARILRPGGVFSGSAAFLEPYCAMWPTHFQASPDGLVMLLTWAGLEVTALWAQESWTVFEALASIPGSLTPPTRWMLRRLGSFERWARRWRLHPRHRATRGWLRKRSPAEEMDAVLAIAGQVEFVARRPE